MGIKLRALVDSGPLLHYLDVVFDAGSMAAECMGIRTFVTMGTLVEPGT